MRFRNTAIILSALTLAGTGLAGTAIAAPAPGHHNVTGATTSGSTSASTSKSHTKQANGAASPEASVIECFYNSNAPEFLVKGASTVYASSNITSCTDSPPPIECHVISNIEIYKQGELGGWVWTTAGASADSGWTKCSTKSYRSSYKCVGTARSQAFRNLTTLAFTFNDDGTILDTSSVKMSGTSYLFCDE